MIIFYEAIFSIGILLFLGAIFFKRFIKNEIYDYDKNFKMSLKQVILLRISMFIIGGLLIVFVLIMTIEL